MDMETSFVTPSGDDPPALTVVANATSSFVNPSGDNPPALTVAGNATDSFATPSGDDPPALTVVANATSSFVTPSGDNPPALTVAGNATGSFATPSGDDPPALTVVANATSSFITPSSDDPPAFTVVGKPTGICILNYYNFLLENRVPYRIPKLLLSDIHNAEYVATTKLFNFKKYKFKQVSICGEVLLVAPYKSNYLFTVDDGTAVIRVFGYEESEDDVQLNLDLAKYTQEVNARVRFPKQDENLMNGHTLSLEQLEEQRKWKNIANVCHLMLKEANRTNSSKVTMDQIDCGDIMVFQGTLAQHEDRRHIFAVDGFKIMENDVEFRADWFKFCKAQHDDNTSFFNSQWDEHYDIPYDFFR